MKCDVVVVGSGLAGSAAAIRLAQAGLSVVLLEKEKSAHHKVCGEFLSAECTPMLQELGITPPPAAQKITSLRLQGYGQEVVSPLPFVAHGLSRFWLDEALLRRAQAVGAQVVRGCLAQSLKFENNEFRVPTAQGEYSARQVFWAAGKHEAAHVHRREGPDREWLGYKMHFRLAPEVSAELEHKIDLAIFPQAYGGWLLVEDGSANLCLALRKDFAQSCDFSWPKILQKLSAQTPRWARLLSQAEPCWPRPLVVANIPYGYLTTADTAFYLLGDQAAVVPSFAGDGMAMALWSAQRAVENHLRGGTPTQFAKTLHGDFNSVLRVNRLLQIALLKPALAQTLLWSLSRMPQALPWLVGKTRVGVLN